MTDNILLKRPEVGLNVEFSSFLIKNLISLGINHFIICPGSRNTPLIAALAIEESCHKYSVLDERSAAFMALGFARAGHKAAVLTTSGTAVANLLPAMVEASQDQIFLMAITADRPFELHNIGENQCIDQQHIFGNFANYYADISAPNSSDEIKEKLSNIFSNLQKSKQSFHNTVHLNIRFKKPLEPVFTEEPAPQSPKNLEILKKSAPEPLKREDSALENLEILKKYKRPFLLIGALKQHQRQAVLEIVKHLQWPTYADIQSGLPREDTLFPRIHSRILHHSDFFQNSAFDVCLYIGTRVTFPQVLEELKLLKIKVLQFTQEQAVHDSRRIVSTKVRCDLTILKNQILRDLEPQEHSSQFAQRFINADKFLRMHAPLKAQLNDEASFDSMCQCFEATSVGFILSSLPSGSQLFLGNSMVVRDADMYACHLKNNITIACNRGASGIDGNIATAIGIALATKKPSTAILGDLTFLHDIGSLLSLKQLNPKLRIFVLNNSGGGIFNHLPIAKHKEVLEPWVNTPQNVDFANICKGYELSYTLVTSFKQLQEICSTEVDKAEIIEIKSDKQINYLHHQALKKETRALLSKFSKQICDT